jgi:uncharacterized protein (TIGR00730 family)
MTERPTGIQRQAQTPGTADAAERGTIPAHSPNSDLPAYRLAFADSEFLLRDELRPERLQLEFLKPELALLDQGVKSTVVIFGSARIPDPQTAATQAAEAEQRAQAQPDNPELQQALAIARRIASNSIYYQEARRLGDIIARATLSDGPCDLVVMTGGGPGIMEAANRGAMEAGGMSIGLNIQLPFEQRPNPYITPELCFQFHYFALRKMHFLKRARALVACPGGFGTLDELFDALTLIQTGKIEPLPVLLMGSRYWKGIINFEAMVEEGVISPKDMEIFRYVEDATEAWDVIRAFYGVCNGPA